MGIDLIVGFVVGGAVVGWIAHKKPTWFNSAVTFVNAVDDKVNSTVKGSA